MESFMSQAWWVLAPLHAAFMLIALIGFIAAVIWLNKHAKKNDVKKVMTWALIIGIVGAILTAPFAMNRWHYKNAKYDGKKQFMNSQRGEAMKKMESKDMMEKSGVDRSTAATTAVMRVR